MKIDPFQMEQMQSKYWHLVDHDLSESGVTPMTIRELLGPAADAETLLATPLGYPLSEGSYESRSNIAAWYAGATAENVSLTTGGSEANHLTLWTLLDRDDRLAFMIPNYLQGWGLGRHYGKGSDTFRLKLRDGRWRLDLDELERAVTKETKAVMVCNPNNPTGYVLTDDEMNAVITAADRVGAWIVSDEVYRGTEVDADQTSPTFWGRYDKVVVTSGLSKAFAMPGLRIGWTLGPEELIRDTWVRHDYTTLTPGAISDRLCAFATQPEVRENIFARTRGIIRANLPHMESWIHAHDDVFTYARPVAGAIAYVKYDLPIRSTALVDRVRQERSVLLMPGDMFGLGKGIRYGFGFDIEHTMKGLEPGRRPAHRRGPVSPVRCEWAPLGDPAYLAYHDEEWGVPSHDDRHLFEMLTLEGAQAGLSWATILHKREGYRKAFAGFDPAKVARFDRRKVDRLLQDPSIVRNRLKVESTVANARATLAVRKELGSIDAYLWSFVGGAPIVSKWRRLSEIPSETDRSRAMSKDLKKRGFRFVGPTVCYALMQATGMVNDHVSSCFRY